MRLVAISTVRARRCRAARASSAITPMHRRTDQGSEQGMTERNEMGHAASTDVGPQPSLDLPGRRKTRVGKLRLELVALAVIALGAAGGTIYLQRLFQHQQHATQASPGPPRAR